MPKHVIKQFGLQRTGTNYVRLLLLHNYPVKILTNGGGWKHGHYKLNDDTDCVVMTKHLLGWLPSYWRYAGRPGTFEGFVRRGTHVEHWNMLHAHWLRVADSLKNSKMVFCRCEDLVRFPKRECAKIAKALGLKRSKGKFWDTNKRITANGKLTPALYDRRAYLQQRYLKNYNKGLLKFVSTMQDDDVARRLGYRPI